MDIVIVFVICVLLCLLVSLRARYTRKPHTLKKKLTNLDKKHVSSETPERRTCASVKRDHTKGDEAAKESEAGNGAGEAGERRTCAEKRGDEPREKAQETLVEQREEYGAFRSFVQTNKLDKEMEEAGTTHGLNTYIKRSFEGWKKQEINIAVTGQSGAGKSSLINALRKLKPSDHGAAKVGVVEITIDGMKYTYPENKLAALWDLPGNGTQKFTIIDKYLNTIKISQFDVVIIVTAVRFLENDMWLAKQSYKLGKHVLFVRTKIDSDLMNAKRDYPKDFSEEKYTSEIIANIIENMHVGGLTPAKIEIYLVSSADRNSYDFKKLDEKLKGLLNMRAGAIPALLMERAKLVIMAKQSSNKHEFKWRKFGSVIYGFLPIPNLETGFGNLIVSSIHERCLENSALIQNRWI